MLDIGCGAGASALPAARAVGQDGRVVGIDLSGELLEIARRRAAADGLENTEFRVGDMTALDYADGRFDTVISVFSIFFVPDMEAWSPSCGGWCGPAAGLRLRHGDRISSSPYTAAGSMRSSASGPICTVRSTHGTGSPTWNRCDNCCWTAALPSPKS
ncbi:class I SAM-dependent methyltransferase [Parasphingopyxis algicola]|nr:class I SAM-dependent methyltransferase [Parasphingopyxis algicola]